MILQSYTTNGGNKKRGKMIIPRDKYLNRIIDYMGDGQIKVITGIRRCGKSVLLFDIFYGYLLKQGVKEEQIIKIQLDQRKNAKYRNPIVLAEYIESFIQNKKKTYYVLIDEIQFCLDVDDPDNAGEKITVYDLLNELKSYSNLDVYVTGSNSKMLSTDIETQFRGRASRIHVWPLSFSEYHSYYKRDKREDFDQYMIYGGMPYLLTRKNNQQRKDYLISLYEEVYIKDIKERNNIQKIDILEKMLDYLSSTVSSLTNPNNIAKALKEDEKIETSNHTVATYLSHIEDAFLVEKAARYDIKGKKYFEYPFKYYYTDVGLRNARLNFRQQDKGHIMENIIYNELRMRGYSVDIGVVEEKTNKNTKQREIDFIVNYGDKKLYIQSAYEIEGDEKAASETASLKLTKDFFQKIVIQRDVVGQYTDEDGILHCNIIDFLLDENIVF